MSQPTNPFTEKLAAKGLINEPQLQAVKAYGSKRIFSLHNELRFFLYLSVLLFTSGIGIVIYQNIDNIGHMAILSAIFLLTAAGFYFCFKKAKGFEKDEVLFDNPVYDYLVLLSTILSCIFIGYFQYQYQVFGYGLSSLACSLIAFCAAYYYDNKSALSIGITGLGTFIGITVTPKTLIQNEIYSNPALPYYGLALGVLLLLWTAYSNRIELKKHFQTVFLTFAQHLIGICCIAGLVGDYWPIFMLVAVSACYYFYRISKESGSTLLFVFMLLYGYIEFNILVVKILYRIEVYELDTFLTLLAPVYFVGSIFGFVKLIQHFNKEKA